MQRYCAKMDSYSAREMFEQLSRPVYGRQLIYLDNAATSLRPKKILEEFVENSVGYNANLHRAVHHYASVATEKYENTRNLIHQFIGSAYADEIVFTSGTTASINLVAFSLGELLIHPGDEILVGDDSHHSNILPWQMLCERKGARLRHFDPLVPVGQSLTPKTKIVAVSHISNVLGLVNPVKEIVSACHAKGIPVLVDGAQGIVHEKVDVKDLDCDFYAFSGHKMYAVPGTGVLYGKREWLEKMPPYMGGGEMIGTVSWDQSTFAPPPQKFEAGTQNFTGVFSFREAISVANEMRCPEIEKEQLAIKEMVEFELRERMEGVTLHGGFGQPNRVPLFSFSVEGAHHEDIALILDKMGIAVRSGQMCAEPLMKKCGVTGMVRAAFAPYNTMSDAEHFISGLKKAVKMLRK